MVHARRSELDKTPVMMSFYFWFFFSALYFTLAVHGYGGMIPKASNEVLYWEQQQQQKHGVTKQVDGKYANGFGNSSRRLFGRHVCTQSKVVMVPMKDMQSYCKPMYQSYLRRCDEKEKTTSGYCTGYRVVYELAYRTVQRLVSRTESTYQCCPGWTQALVSSSDCKRAVCREPCRNGGYCTKPDHCVCPPGWTGKTCDTDIDECTRRRHGCDHECQNLPGSYKCSCREGFTLQGDGKSCKKEDKRRSSEDDAELLKKIDHLQQRLSALEEWQRRLNSDGPDSRHQRDDRINSLSEQMAILEETLEDCSCYRRKGPPNLPLPQK